jgi:hypothetical protein
MVCPPGDAGDSFAAATSIQTGVNVLEYACASGDQDYWKFAVEHGEEIFVAIDNLPADLDLVLLDPSGGVVAQSAVWGADKGESILRTAWQDGEWRALVYPKGPADWSKTTPYRIRVNVTTVCYSPDEAGNTFLTAAPIAASVPQGGVVHTTEGTICPAGDLDYYRFDVPIGQAIAITARLTELPADYDLFLVRPDGATVADSRQSGTVDETITFVAENRPGAWRVVVAPGSSLTFGPQPYTLEVSLASDLDLVVQGVEVTQAIQSVDNAVSLAAGKQAVARVYVKSVPGRNWANGFKVDLYGWRWAWGVAQPFPDSPLSSSDGKASGSPIETKRLSMGSSVNFQLPPAWLAGGNLHFEARVNPDHAFPETDYANNSLATDVDVTGLPGDNVVNVQYAPVRAAGLTPALGGSTPNTITAFARHLLPVSRVDVWLRSGPPIEADYDYVHHAPGQCGDGWNRLLAQLEDAWDGWPDRPPHSFVFGLLDANVPHGSVIGCGDGAGHSAGGYLSAGTPSTVAHELGHTLRRLHANGCMPVQFTDPNWPNATNPGAVIGETGVNVFTNEVFDPWGTFDVMSYCDPEWLAPYTWTGMLGFLQQESLAARALVGARTVTVSGQIADGELTELRPAWVEERGDGPHAEVGSGPATIEVQDGAGATLFVRAFDPEADCLDESQTCGDFRETLPFPTGAARLVVRHQGAVLRTVTASPHPPAVRVTTPNGGESWLDDDEHRIAWTAHDDDGDPLSARVYFSRDGGASWTLLASAVTGQELDVSGGSLPGGSRARVRVMVSDGLNTTSDDSDADFLVASKAPVVFPGTPADSSVVAPGQPVLLSGAATDREDGPLHGESLRWVSSLDGDLGTGDTLLVPGLSCGDHEITLVATDSDETSAQAVTHVASCCYELDQAALSFIAAGESQVVVLSCAADACPWSVSGGASWLHVAGPTEGVGGVQLTVVAEPNPTMSPRAAALTIAGETVEIAQEGRPGTPRRHLP